MHDLGMRVQHLLDFARKELLPTTVDDLLQTSHDAHVASGIALAEVTGPKPAVGGEEFGIGGGILVVAKMHRGPGSRDLTLCSWRDLASVLVKEAQAHAYRCSADSARHRLGIIRQAREGVKAGLEHAIEFDQVPGHPARKACRVSTGQEAPPVITTRSE